MHSRALAAIKTLRNTQVGQETLLMVLDSPGVPRDDTVLRRNAKEHLRICSVIRYQYQSTQHSTALTPSC